MVRLCRFCSRMHEADNIGADHDIATFCRYHSLTLVLCARHQEL